MDNLSLLFDSRQFEAAFRAVAATPAGVPAHEENVAAATAIASPLEDKNSRARATLLDELLAQSIRLRNLYRNARRQALDVPLHQLRPVFEDHYKEQLRLVDVLIDRMRMLGGADRIMAGDILQSAGFNGGLRGRQARQLLLRELLDEHESILSVADQAESGDRGGGSS